MVDMLNAVGVTHVSLGNHEADLPLDVLAERIGARLASDMAFGLCTWAVRMGVGSGPLSHD